MHHCYANSVENEVGIQSWTVMASNHFLRDFSPKVVVFAATLHPEIFRKIPDAHPSEEQDLPLYQQSP